MSHIFFWIIVGAIAGLFAKAVMPGGAGEPSGTIMTIILGIFGAVVGGFIAQAAGLAYGGWIGTTVVAFMGACVVIGLLRLISGSRRTI